ncbi:MAG: pantetheine-phosphate adenylyltransferase [Anaerolineaceae bacterium 4572_78]|nr:MAG: pantetheine-phosphate adenylyltransferase [Anaerolineaceae bacterium 4572_78]
MITALYPASFDPITYGHVDVAERASKLFDEVVVGVFDKPLKNILFSSEERYSMTCNALAHIDNVHVVKYSGLTIKFAHSIGANVMVRGLRVISDFEWEMQLALANKNFAPDIETVCFMSSHRYSFVSSSLVREIAMHGGSVSDLTPPHVVELLQKKYKEMGKI